MKYHIKITKYFVFACRSSFRSVALSISNSGIAPVLSSSTFIQQLRFVGVTTIVEHDWKRQQYKRC